jgi:hypothetical protein
MNLPPVNQKHFQAEEVKNSSLMSRGQFKYRCLIANDDPFQMMAASYNLKQHSIEILLEGCNGLEIFQYIKNNPN